MYEIVVLFICLFLSSVGVGSLLGFIWLFLLKPKNCKSSNCVVFIDTGNGESTVNYYLEKFRWYGTSFYDKIYFICDEKFLNFYKNICTEYQNVYILTFEQFCDLKK